MKWPKIANFFVDAVRQSHLQNVAVTLISWAICSHLPEIGQFPNIDLFPPKCIRFWVFWNCQTLFVHCSYIHIYWKFQLSQFFFSLVSTQHIHNINFYFCILVAHNSLIGFAHFHLLRTLEGHLISKYWTHFANVRLVLSIVFFFVRSR